MFSPYYDLAKQLRFRISRLRLIEENLKQVHPLFQTVFKTFLKDKEKIVNALQLPYANAKLEATNNLIKLIKRNAISFRNFEKFKNGFSSLLTSKKKGQNSSFLDLSWLQPTTVDKELFLVTQANTDNQIKEKTRPRNLVIITIPAAGVEPARPCGHWILSSITPLFKSYNPDLIGF